MRFITAVKHMVLIHIAIAVRCGCRGTISASSIAAAIAVRCGCGGYHINNIAAAIAIADCNLKPYKGLHSIPAS